LPSNNGAGYVIRRILRRAIRYGFTFLNTKEAFIYQLVETLSNQMGAFFPEIVSQKALVMNVIKEEENSFLRTLDQGIVLLNNAVEAHRLGAFAHLNEDERKDFKFYIISGKVVFELYDTFGFPKDLTALILKEKGYSYNEEEYESELQKQKTRSKAASVVSTEDWNILVDGNVEQFVGYDQVENEVKITRIRKIDSKKDGILYQIVLDTTPFYPEGGGQVGDKGTLVSANETIQIIDTKKENNLILHITKQLPENLTAPFSAKVDTDLRTQSSKNHSATHLMHQALRTILGTHVEQKGSLVNPQYLRFDFSHFSKVTDEQLKEVENFVNKRIQEQLPLIERRNIPFKQAVEEGAMALFGEKYGDSVRAIKFGESMELCGGIHVKNTAEIWHFKIISEGAVAAGIRRIEAITSDAVKDFYNKNESLLVDVKNTLKNPQDVIKSIVSLQDDNALMKKQIEQLMKEKVEGLVNSYSNDFQIVNNINFLTKQVDLSMTATKDLAFALGNSKPNSFVFLASIEDGLPNIHCYISKNLVAEKGLNANVVIKESGKHIDGNGGGQPFFASGKGKKADGIKAILEAAINFIN